MIVKAILRLRMIYVVIMFKLGQATDTAEGEKAMLLQKF
jgi:hypothetical protein